MTKTSHVIKATFLITDPGQHSPTPHPVEVTGEGNSKESARADANNKLQAELNRLRMEHRAVVLHSLLTEVI